MAIVSIHIGLSHNSSLDNFECVITLYLMNKRRQPTSPKVRAEALKLLSAGKVTLPEMAMLIGASTQSVWNWCRESGIDWKKARLGVISADWRKVSK